MVRIYQACDPDLSPFGCVVPMLEKLRRINRYLGVITDGQPRTQLRKLKNLGLMPYLDAIYITGNLGVDFYKPHPRIFEEAGAACGYAYADILYVGDNPSKDFEAPKKLGMRTMRVVSGEYRHIRHQTTQVDHVCTDSSRLAEDVFIAIQG